VKRRKQTDGSVSKAIIEEQKTEEPITKPSFSARQPALVTGGVLRDYQLAGVEWLISLWENGLNGILADEMGLGKTLQTIGFIAHLKSMQVAGPYLIVTPLSTLANWVNEFKRFAPSINVLLYHGSKEERQHMINRKMPKKKETNADFPVIVTSYEIVMNDRKFLQRYHWKYIVVDEGHRLKNMNCRLIKELKTYSSANRLLLTGTPLQNNLAELWSLLNFLLPDIFDDLDMFQSWFV
jgi:ATP-dependent DNA helicase